jgi:hypothetical protein
MKLLAAAALIAAALWLPYAFIQAAALQAQIDARNAVAERLARLAP